MRNKNFKKRELPGDIRFWPIFPRIIECDKLQEQPISVQKFFDNYCGKYNILSVTLERLLQTQFFEKKITFPLKKIFGHFFLISPTKEDFE